MKMATQKMSWHPQTRPCPGERLAVGRDKPSLIVTYRLTLLRTCSWSGDSAAALPTKACFVNHTLKETWSTSQAAGGNMLECGTRHPDSCHKHILGLISKALPTGKYALDTICGQLWTGSNLSLERRTEGARERWNCITRCQGSERTFPINTERTNPPAMIPQTVVGRWRKSHSWLTAPFWRKLAISKPIHYVVSSSDLHGDYIFPNCSCIMRQII